MTVRRTAARAGSHRGGGLVLFLGLTFAISWSLWVVAARWPSSAAGTAALIAGQFGPAAAAVMVLHRHAGPSAVRQALRRHVALRGARRALVAAALLPVGIALTGLALHRLIGGTAIAGSDYPPLLLPVVFGYVLVLGGPLGEELGWRGFALPRLEQRGGPVQATLVLWVVWAVWHVPLFFVDGSVQSLLPFWLWALQLLVMSFLLTWFAHRTPHSLAPVLVLHTSANVTVGTLFVAPPAEPALQPMVLTVAVGAVVAVRLASTATFRTRAPHISRKEPIPPHRTG